MKEDHIHMSNGERRGIIIVIPFFGKAWPTYFRFYLKSCALNPQVTFLFFTNIKAPVDHPPNVQFIDFTIERFNLLASEKLNITVNIEDPYKLCEFKPAYGHVFEDWLEGAAYWGYGDIDIIYGIWNEVFDYKTLSKYDLVSFRPFWISGALALFKNSAKIKVLYRESLSWKEAFSSHDFYSFAECSLLWNRIRNGEDILEIDERESFTFLAKKDERLKVGWFDLLKESLRNDESLLVGSNKGVVEQKSGVSYIGYHLITEKKRPEFKIPTWEVVPEEFCIENDGFYSELQNKGYYWSIKFYRRAKGLMFRIFRKIRTSF